MKIKLAFGNFITYTIDMKTLKQIMDAAGGATKIAEQTGKTKRGVSPKKVGYNAVYKWMNNGIPDIYWTLIIKMAKAYGKPTSADEIFKANKAVRKAGQFSDKRRRK